MIDPHSLKELTKIHKIPKFGVNRPNSISKQDSHLKMSQFYKEMYGLRTGRRTAVRQRPAASGKPYISW